MGMYIYQLNADGSATQLERKIMNGINGYYSSTEGNVGHTRDAMGKLTRITTGSGSYALSWGEGRMLTQYYQNANKVQYTYNADGLREVKAGINDGPSIIKPFYLPH